MLDCSVTCNVCVVVTVTHFLCLVYVVVIVTLCLGLVVQELCESRGGRPGLSVLTSLLVSVDVKNY